jgi:hypothetical protein
MGSGLITEFCFQAEGLGSCRFPSILAKDPPTFHHGLRMDRNRRLTAYLDEISSLITALEMLAFLLKKLILVFISFIKNSHLILQRANG